MNNNNKESLFNKLDLAFYSLEYNLSSAETFRLLNEYQSTKLDNIEKSNNDKYRQALQLSLDYFDIDFITKYKRSKNKSKLLFKLVNSFVNQIDEAKHADFSLITKYYFDECIRNKDIILGNKKWYLRIIPQSKWLIEYLETYTG